jgi:hypothetical protein
MWKVDNLRDYFGPVIVQLANTSSSNSTVSSDLNDSSSISQDSIYMSDAGRLFVICI